MDLIRVAKRISKPKKQKKPLKTPSKKTPLPEIPEIQENVLDPGIEYSFKVDLSLTVDFEGNGVEVSESRLRNKLKNELMAAVKGAVLMAADDFQLRADGIVISPMTISSALNDQTSVGERENR